MRAGISKGGGHGLRWEIKELKSRKILWCEILNRGGISRLKREIVSRRWELIYF
jgi:hypothetical protein